MSDLRNIGARISTNPVAAVRPVEGASLFPPGLLVEAKVAAVLAEGLFRFTQSDGIEFELPLPKKLPEGTPVRISARADGGVTVTVVGDPPDQGDARITAALKEAVRSAAAKQGTMSPLFAMLEELPDRSDLPPQVRQAVQALLSMRVPLDVPPKPAALAQAIARSGLFTEARLAASPDTPPPPDLKTAFSSLRTVVQALVDAVSAQKPSGQSPQQPAGSPAAPTTTPSPTRATGSQVQPALPSSVVGAPPLASSAQAVPELPTAPATQVRPADAAAATHPTGGVSAPQRPAPQPAIPVVGGVDDGVGVSMPNTAPLRQASQPPMGQGGQPSTLPAVSQPTPQQGAVAPRTSTTSMQAPDPPPLLQTVVRAQPPGSPASASVILEPGSAEGDLLPPPLQSATTLPAPRQASPPPQPPPASTPAAGQFPSVPANPPSSTVSPSAPIVPQTAPQVTRPHVLAEAETTTSQNPPTLVRAATSVPALVASLPAVAPALPIMQPRAAPASGPAYPVAHGPDAPPPTHGSSPLSHAPVERDHVMRAAMHVLPVEEIAPRLLADTEAAISRLSLHQMASLPDDRSSARIDAPEARWSCEIPIALDGRTALMGFVVERDGKRNEDPRQQKRWRVQAALDLPETGPLEADVQMRGTAIAAGIWVERSDVAELLEAALPELREGLTAAGFDVETLNVRLGHLSPHLPPPGAFLDQRS